MGSSLAGLIDRAKMRRRRFFLQRLLDIAMAMAGFCGGAFGQGHDGGPHGVLRALVGAHSPVREVLIGRVFLN